MDTSIIPFDPIQITEATSWEELTTVGRELRIHKDKSQWLLGTLASKVEKQYGTGSLERFAKDISIPITSLRIYEWVYQEYTKTNPDFIPPERLSYSVLQTAAKLPEGARDEILRQAEDDSMSVEFVRQAVRKQTGRPVKPKFTLKYCEIHQKWQWYPDKPEMFEAVHEL